MTKQERIEFVNKYSINNREDIIKRGLSLINENTETWDYDLLKKYALIDQL